MSDRFQLLLQKMCLSPSLCRSGRQAGLGWQGSEIPAGCMPGLPASARQCLWTKAGWRLSRDNSTVRNPTSDTPCSREAQPRNRQRVGFYRCRAQPSASGRAAVSTPGCPLGHVCMPSSPGLGFELGLFKGHQIVLQ